MTSEPWKCSKRRWKEWLWTKKTIRFRWTILRVRDSIESISGCVKESPLSTKIRLHSPDYRGVHAARDTKKKEVLLFVPKKQNNNLGMDFVSLIKAKMYEKGLRLILIYPKHWFLSTFRMLEIRNITPTSSTASKLCPSATRTSPSSSAKIELSLL